MRLICPKCGKPLNRSSNQYHCQDNHVYDVARQGYVNLMLANQKHSQQPGDNNESLLARDLFLNRGYYRPLAEKLSEVIGRYMSDGQAFLDAGCGTGYYLKEVMANTGKELEWYATDIAKKGVAMCARYNPQAICFVGNVFHLPFADHSLDGLMSVFCPYSGQEFNRVISTGGIVISVTPGARHLYEMKEIVYSEAYLNPEKGYDLPGFSLLESNKVSYQVTLESSEDIRTLWRMTPYYHTTYAGNNERLFAEETLNTTCEFLVNVYRRG